MGCLDRFPFPDILYTNSDNNCNCSLSMGERILLTDINFKRRVMSSSVRLSVSVMFVRPTQPVEIFGNVSMPFGTFAIR